MPTMPVGWNWKNSMSSSGHAAAVAQSDAVAGQREGVRGDLEHAPEAAGGEHHRAGAEHVQLAVGDAVGDDAARLAAVDQQVDDVVLVEELDAVLDALLVERLQDHVPGSVGREARSAHRRLAEVARVAAEAALVDLALGRPIERQAHVLELDDRLDRLAGQDLGRVLVDQVVAALDRVVHVPLGVVFLDVAERGADAALGGAGVRSSRIELGQHRRLDVRAGQLERGPQAGAAGSDDDGLVVVDGRAHRTLAVSEPPIGRVRMTCVPMMNRITPVV